jgi:hypothetical protein
MENIIFYNPCRNGDIHISRNFVKNLCKHLGHHKYNYFYSHKNPSNLLQDLSHIKYDNESYKKIHPGEFIKKEENNIYINTWYGAKKLFFLKKYKVTFDCLYFLFKEIYSFFKIKIENKNLFNFFPSIDYQNYNISNIDNYFNNQNKDSVLVCNGSVFSNQSYHVNLSSIILELADEFKNKNFILTNKINCDQIKNPNIIFTSDLINNTAGSDLNEISYLSLRCNLIIGRASGPFTFSMVQENLNNPNKKMITFSRLHMPDQNSFFLHEWGRKNIKYKAEIIQHTNANHQEAHNLIKKYLL